MSSPRLMVLDEPSAALSPALTEQVFAEVRRLPQIGVGVLMVEQRARQALAFSDRGYILDSGRIVLTDTGQALLANEHMSDLYIGRGGQARGADVRLNGGGSDADPVSSPSFLARSHALSTSDMTDTPAVRRPPPGDVATLTAMEGLAALERGALSCEA